MSLETFMWGAHVIVAFVAMWVVGLGWWEPSPRVIGFTAFAAVLIAAGGRLQQSEPKQQE